MYMYIKITLPCTLCKTAKPKLRIKSLSHRQTMHFVQRSSTYNIW